MAKLSPFPSSFVYGDLYEYYFFIEIIRTLKADLVA